MKVIEFKNVWEMYRIKFVEEGKTIWDIFWALKDISFKVEKGETLGVIGANGSGKSTILKLVSGMLKPDKGEVIVKARTSGLLELGAGFEPEMTGTENIFTLATLYGLSQEQTKNKIKEITDFADIGRFINAPVKCYSQGMFVRLAFSIAIHMNTDILLIDDTLAVGDEYFQRKCIKKIFELKEQDKTIIFVTHDMNLLRRLCQRVLFLKEGRIIKDDLIDKVIPLYSQMIGSKEGVGILEKEPLNLVFNNGRLFLNWQDKLLTPDSGAYTSFRISDKWYSSLQADWEVKREKENKLIAAGKFYQLALTQIWRLELAENNEVRWDIEMEPEEPLEIQEGCTNIMLTNEYTNWFTTLEKGDFPPINDKIKNWQALLHGNVSSKCIGVETKIIPDDKIPTLAFEQSNLSYRGQSQILNTDYLNNCRVLQYKTLSLQNYSANQANRFIYFSGKIIINIPDINKYLEKAQDEFVLSKGQMKLIFNNGQCILYYNDIALTKINHIDTSIYVNGRWYYSGLAHWEIKKERKDKLIAKGAWPHLGLIQIWEIEITGELSYLWKVTLQVNEEVNIEEQFARFMCSEDYEYWFSDYAKESFPEGFLEDYMDMVQRCIPDGVIGLQSQKKGIPTLSLKFSKELNNFAKIFNSDFYHKARILRVEKIEPEEGFKFLPGEYPCFKIEATLDKEKQVYKEDLVNTIRGKRLSFIFDKGRGRIYWDRIELTKKLGLYTSLHSQGRWYDSASSTLWKIEEKSKDTIKALGKWLRLPIVQYWEIRLREDELIELSVKMEVDKAIEVDRIQTNLMLSERYSQWVADKESGFFPLFKDDVDDDWSRIWSGGDDSKYIGVLENLTDKNSLPSVIFSPQVLTPNWFLNILNSDIYHRGRVLQYLNSKRITVLPGEYSCFCGGITISLKS